MLGGDPVILVESLEVSGSRGVPRARIYGMSGCPSEDRTLVGGCVASGVNLHGAAASGPTEGEHHG